MPNRKGLGSSIALPSRILTMLVFTFGLAAAILWLLPLTTTHALLFPSGPNFEDILVYKGRFTLYHSARFFTSRAYSAFAYPAGAAPLYQAFYSTGNATLTYLLLAAAAVIAALTASWLYLRTQSAAGLFPPLLPLSFPLVFLIQRGNIELFLWVLVATGILAYCRSLPMLAATLFGIAAAIKLYPILLLGLFLKPAATRSKRDLPAFLTGILTALVTMAAAIAYTGPTFAIAAHGFFSGVDRFQGHYVDKVSTIEVLFDHCLFSPLKYIAFTQHLSPAPWRTGYYLCAASLALLLFLRVHTLPFLKRLLFLVAAMVCLPPVSFTYTLVHLYLPMLLLIGALVATQKPPSATALAALGLLLFLMLPLPALAIFGAIPTGPLQATALLGLLILSGLRPWQSPAFATTLL